MDGQPRRVYTYARNLEGLNDWVSISSFALGGSILIFLINFVYPTVIARVPEVSNPGFPRPRVAGAVATAAR